MNDLVSHSIRIIKENQSPTGAYIASPSFENYKYCWFRDGAYIAYSMDLVGENQSAAKFHNWTSEVIQKYQTVIEKAIQIAQEDGKPPLHTYLHTRYTLDGEEDRDEWPNYQLDGIGTWLWSLSEHIKVTDNILPLEWEKSANLAVRYLSALWMYPCSDSREEFPEQQHTYTLASIYAGIKAYGELSGYNYKDILDNLLGTINGQAIQNDHYIKYIGTNLVDANLISLAVPYKIVEPDHPLITRSIKLIEKDLMIGGGVHRYKDDSFYGGGEWIILTAWLGWYWAQQGNHKRAQVLLEWIESKADDKGNLPEQVPTHLNQPEYYDIWLKRWGNIANPLLWSHAKYLILHHNMKKE